MKKTVPIKTKINRPFWIQNKPLSEEGLKNWDEIHWDEPKERTYRVKINGRWVDANG